MSAETLLAEEAGALLGLKPVAVTILCRRGELRASKVGKRWVILRSDLDDFLNERSNRPRRKRRNRAA